MDCERAYRGIPVVYTGNAVKYADCHLSIIEIPKVKNYLDNLIINTVKNGITIESISIDQIYWFCNPDPVKITSESNLGFLMLNTKMNRDGAFVPGIVFVRGNCVAVWIEVKVGEQVYILLVNQYRTPFGDTIVELPAGMVDGDDTFANALTKEIAEECGIVVKGIDIEWLTTIAPSIGGCDELIRLGKVSVTMTEEQFEAAKKSVYGQATEGEHINLVFVPKEQIRDFAKAQPVLDAKIASAMAFYL